MQNRNFKFFRYLLTTWSLFLGVVRCGVEYGNDDYSYVDSEPYHVTPLPSVSVDPLVASVFRGDVLSIECRLTSDSFNTSRLFWFRDGTNLTGNDGLSSNLTLQLNTLFRRQETRTHFCVDDIY